MCIIKHHIVIYILVRKYSMSLRAIKIGFIGITLMFPVYINDSYRSYSCLKCIVVTIYKWIVVIAQQMYRFISFLLSLENPETFLT